MPEIQEDASRDERLANLFSQLKDIPVLGKIGQGDLTNISYEFVLLKLYAIRLEEKLSLALEELGKLVPEEEPVDATNQEDHNHGSDARVEGQPDHPHKH
jgi:hypothetical protein